MSIKTKCWEGDLKGGKGSVKLGSGAFQGAFSFASRFESGTGTNPEELIGAAHAGCYSMALSHMLASKGFTPKKVSTTAEVKLEKVGDGFKITNINLKMEADVPKIDQKTFMENAEAAKKGCPISQALASTNITLEAKLLQNA
ncbi:MAG: peroxiredoxin [Elusimicrobia bacterium RIFCSPLOWO2_01_FULL_54_10]|nr:MAG: peroxiredoxin [Elusimicrobia bacterium RIFCSPLOWO2_01_FULL_54_10]